MREAYLATEQSPKVFLKSLADENVQLREDVLSAQRGTHRAEAALAGMTEENRSLIGNQDFVYRIFDSSSDCIKIIDLDGSLRMMNTGGQRVMEIDEFAPYIGAPWLNFWGDEHKLKVSEAMQAAMRGGTGHFKAPSVTAKDTPKWWDVLVTPIKDADGTIINLLAVSRDITAEMELRDQHTILMRELEHRVKNVLAVVQSIAQQTFKDDVSPVEARKAFIARLGMLSRANDILLRDNWESSSLTDLIVAAMAPYSGKGSRINIAGPAVQISGQGTLGLALALHELATNAAKYGALSNSGGKVDIRWAIEGENEEAIFNFYWLESGGPTVVAPTKKGFGSRLIQFTVASQFKGEAKSDYRPSGLVFEIVAPLSALQ